MGFLVFEFFSFWEILYFVFQVLVFCCSVLFCFVLRKNLKLSGSGRGEDLEELKGGEEDGQTIFTLKFCFK